MNTTNKLAWFVFAFMAIGVGLYPLLYAFVGQEFGLLMSKSAELLANNLWKIGFYGHISFGGLALLIGWSQFSPRFRKKNIQQHRKLGAVYILAAIIGGSCGIYIGFYATGGLVSSLGFISLGIIWLLTTLMAFTAIKKKDIKQHQVMMIYSYAACFAAVTLRVWLPILTIVFGEFLIAYKIVAWLCWVPNMVFAFFWVKRGGIVLG